MKTQYQPKTQLQAHFEPRTQLRDYCCGKSLAQGQNERRLSDGYEKGIKVRIHKDISLDSEGGFFKLKIYHPGNYALRRFQEETGLPEEIIPLSFMIRAYDSAIDFLNGFKKKIEEEREKLKEEARDLISKQKRTVK